jgi:hypothetical protein
MRIDFHGLGLETPGVTVYLWSPWRATALEHRLFESVLAVPRTTREDAPDERRIHITDPKTFHAAQNAVARVLKGWQEEADPGVERRAWRWLLEGDADADGYDHAGEPFTLWGFLRIGLDRDAPGEQEKGEDIDLEGFGLRIWGRAARP